MALPAGVLTVLGEAAMNPKVQGFAAKLVNDVYSKIMPSKVDALPAPEAEIVATSASLDDVIARLDNVPTNQEIATSFAVLQAELERQHQQTRKWLWGVAALQIALIAIFLSR